VTTAGECRPIPTTHLVLIYTFGHIGCSIGLETDGLSSMSGLSGTCSTVRRLGTRSLMSLDLVLDKSVSQLVLHLDKHWGGWSLSTCVLLVQQFGDSALFYLVSSCASGGTGTLVKLWLASMLFRLHCTWLVVSSITLGVVNCSINVRFIH
jgi:hypothetical protein